MHDFLGQNVLIFPLLILLTRITDTFWSEGISTFWSGVIRNVCHRKSAKIQQYSQGCFELYQLFINNFLCLTVLKHKLLTT